MTHRRPTHGTPRLVTSLPLLARPVSGRVFSRRALLGAAAGLGLAAAAGVSFSASAAGPTGPAKTTAALNLRARSNTGSAVLLVIPQNATVTLNGRMENGFQDVTYNGTHGWAHNDFLVSTGSGPRDSGGAAKVHSSLNLRSGPSTGAQVLRVMPGGATVQLLGQYQNGYYYVSHEGLAGWAYGDWLLVNGTPLGHGDGPPPGGTPGGSPGTMVKTTTAALNLRAGASLGDKVLLVIPQGAQVTDTGTLSNNFAKVDYKGTVGWAYIDYLR